MNTYYLLFLLILSIAFIVWATAYKKLNAVFALLIAAIVVGMLSDLPATSLAGILKKGFGATMEKVGLLIILGTALGVILEKTGATMAMANAILRKVHERNAPIAVSLAGFIIGLPIFCDSGFIILNGLNHSLVAKTRFGMPVMACALATSLYAVHCLVPPHPGITAAVGTIGGDIGLVMVWGTLLAIPCAAAGYFWSMYAGPRVTSGDYEPSKTDHQMEGVREPNTFLSFAVILFPIALIAAKSLVMLFIDIADNESVPLNLILFAGDPVIALGAGTLLSLSLVSRDQLSGVSSWLTQSVERAGIILAIIAAGGMFGEMLQATGAGKQLSELLKDFSLVIFLPFLITTIIKTAQGSSTVAIITAASLVAPMMSDLGFSTPTEVTLMILSMGAGSMMVSHANDAYFWVISRFSELSTQQTLRTYTIASIIMGITTQLIISLIYALG